MILAKHPVIAPLAIGASLALAPAEADVPRYRAPLLACLPAQEAPAEPATAPQAERDPVRELLVAHLSRRFYVAAEATERIVEAAYRAGSEAGIDPFLVLAVISVESSFNPIAESVVGAKGLMQIIPKFHRETLAEHGGDDALLDPVSNVLVGTKILREYVRRTGSLEAGLQFYNGASEDPSARYTRKVMAERQRLELVARGAESRGI